MGLSSLLGVGAPEVLVIGLVALVVFGPKGLADATKSISQIFRTFQPTLQEIISISKDLNASFKNEIGLQEPLRIETKSNVKSRFVSSKGENEELNTKIIDNSQKDIISESGTNSNKNYITCTNRKIMIDLPMKELIKEIK